ncbi:LPP20 family lipoprotein [Sulfurimonas sp. C5]|uniref:LPP20 family lipoprotein n=1 Tax=Sulfurimonas sp. C5 TaxID=3036947 RepID=UPI0024545F7B|nr:LPP20 family lipoprotein [Sulfurimonas sp. C5]MDH4945374.1 LPP20 family lipoprotein [Sulfurimonas sp. C5]
MKKILTYFLVFTFLLSGCGSATKQIELTSKKELPAWYTTPPMSNSSVLYALGEGKDKQEAIANALNYMASTLSVSISSTYRAKTRVVEGSTTSQEGEYNSDIASDVKKIRISNYEVIQSESLGFKRYAVLIRSDKQKLFHSLQQELDQSISLANAKENNLNNGGLEKYLFYKEQKKEFANLPHTLIVMKELNSGFNSSVYLQRIKEIEKKYQYYQSNISFSVSSNIKNLHTPIEKALSKRSFRINNTSSKMHYIITVNASVTKANAYGFTLARSELNIITKNYKGVKIASNVLHLVGQSSQGYDVAIQDLVRQLNDKIKKDGIDKVLNLNI